tara:strand:- start:404 stop:781 length:378 start_codon:yes stop_codon:yes gene_type:complete
MHRSAKRDRSSIGSSLSDIPTFIAIRRGRGIRMERVEFSAELAGGREIVVSGTRDTTWVRDASYGADADGNRGEDTGWQIEEDLISDVQILDLETGAVVPLASVEPRVAELIADYLRVTPPDDGS